MPEVTELVYRHEGKEAAAILSHWLQRQSDGVVALRDRHGTVMAFMAVVDLESVQMDDLVADAGTRALYGFFRKHVRPGEKGCFIRTWLARDTYQSVSHAQSQLFVAMIQHFLSTPKLAWSFIACADPDFWHPFFAGRGFFRVDAATVTVGGLPYGVFGHDWRPLAPLAWLNLWADSQRLAALAESAKRQKLPATGLDRKELAAAVRDALRSALAPLPCTIPAHSGSSRPALRTSSSQTSATGSRWGAGCITCAFRWVKPAAPWRRRPQTVPSACWLPPLPGTRLRRIKRSELAAHTGNHAVRAELARLIDQWVGAVSESLAAAVPPNRFLPLGPESVTELPAGAAARAHTMLWVRHNEGSSRWLDRPDVLLTPDQGLRSGLA